MTGGRFEMRYGLTLPLIWRSMLVGYNGSVQEELITASAPK